jgi:hypothetical protein
MRQYYQILKQHLELSRVETYQSLNKNNFENIYRKTLNKT